MRSPHPGLTWPVVTWQAEPWRPLEINSGASPSPHWGRRWFIKKAQGKPALAQCVAGRIAAHRGASAGRRSSLRTVSCGRDATLPQGRTVRNFPLEEEGAVKTTWNRLGCWEERAEPGPGRSEGREEGAFKIWCYFLLSRSDSVGKLVVVLLFKLNRTGERALPAHCLSP